GFKAKGILGFARKNVIGKQFRRCGDGDNADFARTAQIHRHGRAGNIEMLGHFVLPQTMGIIEPGGLMDYLIGGPDRH
ncbi:hypothetical protein NZA98_37055, partial [Escherichia coli]|nr:hypothetical protein [Escherichia coli]